MREIDILQSVQEGFRRRNRRTAQQALHHEVTMLSSVIESRIFGMYKVNIRLLSVVFHQLIGGTWTAEDRKQAREALLANGWTNDGIQEAAAYISKEIQDGLHTIFKQMNIRMPKES